MDNKITGVYVQSIQTKKTVHLINEFNTSNTLFFFDTTKERNGFRMNDIDKHYSEIMMLAEKERILSNTENAERRKFFFHIIKSTLWNVRRKQNEYRIKLAKIINTLQKDPIYGTWEKSERTNLRKKYVMQLLSSFSSYDLLGYYYFKIYNNIVWGYNGYITEPSGELSVVPQKENINGESIITVNVKLDITHLFLAKDKHGNMLTPIDITEHGITNLILCENELSKRKEKHYISDVLNSLKQLFAIYGYFGRTSKLPNNESVFLYSLLKEFGIVKEDTHQTRDDIRIYIRGELKKIKGYPICPLIII